MATLVSVVQQDGTTVFINPAFWTTASAIDPQTVRITVDGADPVVAQATIDQVTQALTGLPSKQATPIGVPFGQPTQSSTSPGVIANIMSMLGLGS